MKNPAPNREISPPHVAGAQAFHDIRGATSALVVPLSAEDCVIQSMPETSPVKWHLAHTTWFFETFVLAPHSPGYRVFHPGYKVLFNSYYHGVGDMHPRPERGLVSRPGLEEIQRYRQHVDAALQAFLCTPVSPAVEALVTLGLNHEQQHQELILTDVKHLLSRNPLQPPYRKPWPLTAIEPKRQSWIGVEAGLYEVGHAGEGFHFDNEAPRHRVHLNEFQMASHPVTNGEFVAFIEDEGYQRPELWLSAGWDALRARAWKAPLYWDRIDGRWHTFTLHGLVPVAPDAPVCHLSFMEAEAYARWAGARLPTEAEWEIVAARAPRDGNFLEGGAFHPLAPREQDTEGVPAQMFGDVWEWTRSDYAPYPGFRPAPGLVGEYNGKFMCGQYVLRGGSCATPRSHIRPTYRNFFPAEARWQFSGLRLARDL